MAAPQYGAVQQLGSKAGGRGLEAGGGRGQPRPEHSRGAPLFLENPDGTIAEAVPVAESKLRAARAKKAIEEEAAARHQANEDAVSTMFQEIDELQFLYIQHVRCLALLLTFHLSLVALYNVVFIYRIRSGASANTLHNMYGWEDENRLADRVLWAVFAMQLVYHMWFYSAAGTALWTGRPVHYRDWACGSLVGIIGLVFFAYVDKFNLLIFFLNLLTYIYARYMQGLSASLLLLPPGPPNTAP